MCPHGYLYAWSCIECNRDLMPKPKPKRERLKAWAIVYETGAVVLSAYPVVPFKDNKNCKIKYKVVPLVEKTR